MKTTVVCGMLGAGKTTFIRKQLAGAREKTVVLVNDFGQAGIDGDVFSADGIESIELPSGCVCCTLRLDMITTIPKVIAQFAPEHLVLEPSGVASPSAVLEVLGSLGLSPVTVVGIVDCTEFLELHESGMYGRFFEDQIVCSDVILLNKADLAGADGLRRTQDVIEGLNPSAVIFRTVHAELKEPVPAVSAAPKSSPGSAGHLSFEPVTVRFSGVPQHAAIRGMFERMAGGAYGMVIRAKALARTTEGCFRFDLSSGRVDHGLFGGDVSESRIVIIGTGIDEAALRRDAAPFLLI